MKRTYARSSDSFPGRVDSSNCKLNSVVINILLRVSSTFSAILSTLRWTELSLRGIDFMTCSGNLCETVLITSLTTGRINCSPKKCFKKPTPLWKFISPPPPPSSEFFDEEVNIFIVFRYKNWSRREWKNASVLPDLSGWIFCKCSKSLDGFIASLEKFFSQTKHMGCCGLVGINPYFKYSTEYCLHFFFNAPGVAMYVCCPRQMLINILLRQPE